MNQLVIQFDPSLGFWTVFTYWFVVVNTFLCAGFTLLVIVGGMFDLRFLFRALNEEVVDDTDDGRVDAPPAGQQQNADSGAKETTA